MRELLKLIVMPNKTPDTDRKMWLWVIEHTANQVYRLIQESQNLKSLGEVDASAGRYEGGLRLDQIADKITIVEGGPNLETEGVFGILNFDSNFQDRSQSTKGLQFGYTVHGEWLLITTMYHCSPEYTTFEWFLETVTVEQLDLNSLMSHAKYPEAIFMTFHEVTENWRNQALGRIERVEKAWEDQKLIQKLIF